MVKMKTLSKNHKRKHLHRTSIKDIINSTGQQYDPSTVGDVSAIKTRTRPSVQLSRNGSSMKRLTKIITPLPLAERKKNSKLHPSSSFRSWWDLITLALLLYTAIFVV